ncbi:MAG: hypothetical protein KDC34_15565 [Saprospiraceae bacterium]|nr:hypothetical protein [Saprospiraceae bacterium]
MTLIGNLILGIATLIFFVLFDIIYIKPMPRGDAVVGYTWSLILGVAVFSICLIIVALLIGSQGGYALLGSPGTVLILLSVILILLGNGFFTLMAGEKGYDLPPLIRQLFRYIPAILPPLLIIAAACLLHADQKVLPAIAYKLPIWVGLGSGLAALALIMVNNAQNANAQMQSAREYKDKIYQDHLNQIDSTDVSKDLVFLFVFTDANHNSVVRERALAKIKTRPDWEAEVISRLQNDWAPEAFTFLASNDVSDKTLFPEAVRQGVLIQARLIRESIGNCRNSYDLYSDRFTWEVDRVLRTVDKFQEMGVDYRPAVQELLRALDEPSDFEKPKFKCSILLEKWLKAN